MNLKNTTKLDDLGKVLFADGWFFFVPYLFFYLVFKYLHLKISDLENIFFILHIINSLGLIHYLYKFCSNNHFSKLLFWLVIILLFQIPGAYLEFPSDAWEHFRRIFEWQTCVLVDDHSTYNKFTYFWGWTLMSEVQPIYRRTALDIYSTFWQFLLAYQFYLFALRIGFSESWAKVQVLGTICLFGTNIFSFYRYYALSSTPLAYIAYLRSLTIILDSFDGKRKKAIELIFLIPIIYYNHYQEILLLLISFLAVSIANFYKQKKINKITIFGTISILILCLFIVTLFVTSFQKYSLLITNFWNSYLQNYFTEKTPNSFVIEPNYWSKLGFLRIWDQKLPYFQTLGIYGYISMLFSIILWKKYKVLCTLTFFPLLLLFFQPFTLFIATLEDQYTTFRVLYAFPYSFMLVVGFKETFKSIYLMNQKFNINKYIIIFMLIFLSLQSNLPWRGRLWHLLYNTPAQLSLINLDITAQWFFKNRPLRNYSINAQFLFGKPKINSRCLLVTDNATSFSLVTHLGLQFQGNQRLYPYNPSQSLMTFDSLKNYIQSGNYQKPCSFLVGIPAQINPPPISKVGQVSNHWLPDIVKQDFNYSKEFVEVTEFLTSLGWTKTFVPPFYWLYEAPSTNSSHDSST